MIRYKIKSTIALSSGSSFDIDLDNLTVLWPSNSEAQTLIAYYFLGSPEITATPSGNGSYSATIAAGNFRRSIATTSSGGSFPPASQYYGMMMAEESFHAGQFKGTNSTIFSNLWLSQSVLNAANAGGPYVGSSSDEARNAAQYSFNQATTIVENEGNIIASSTAYRCAAEKEAKIAVGSSYRAKLKCTYPSCP